MLGMPLEEELKVEGITKGGLKAGIKRMLRSFSSQKMP
jgi:hypothetical protein